jgi:hypothetical protein
MRRWGTQLQQICRSSGRDVRGDHRAPYDRVINPDLPPWTRLQQLARDIADCARDCADTAASMSEVIDEVVTGGRPHLTRTWDGPMGVSPFRDDSEVVAAAEDALFVAAVIRLRVVEGGFWTDAPRQKELLRWVVRTLGPLAERAEHRTDA